MMTSYRTHTCDELREEYVKKEVRLAGWLHRKRDHGGLIFVDLRDHYGITQLVFSPEEADIFKKIEHLMPESVIAVHGIVCKRPSDTFNDKLATGHIEVRVSFMLVLSYAEELPIPVFGEADYPEDMRLTYRFLDLRRKKMHDIALLRCDIIDFIRCEMKKYDFKEFQTPILTASSPEGARDFLVPSRLHVGKFYALPQAPQQFKQLIMLSGFDRYFQIAPCFRDEDARSDRSPGEFYQLDVEMSFVTQEDVLQTMEPVFYNLFIKYANGKNVSSVPFVRLTYNESMSRYGTDKPDLRNPLIIQDITSFFTKGGGGVDFQVFSDLVQKGEVVKALVVPNCALQPRSFFDKLTDWACKEMHLPGLAYISLKEENGKQIAKGPITKFLSQNILEAMCSQLDAKVNSCVFFVCDKEKDALKSSGTLRMHIGNILNLIDTNVFEFCWITDFPLYEWNDEEKKIDFSHNPFSMPQGGLKALKEQNPIDIKAYQYDIVCNGNELSSGAIRNHRLDIMYEAFRIAGYSKKDLEEKFGGMVEAFRFGVPPHGGMAPGIDRIVMLLAGVQNIREVILFPLNQKGEDLMMNAPSSISDEQFKELGITLRHR